MRGRAVLPALLLAWPAAAETPYEKVRPVFDGDTTVAAETIDFPKEGDSVKALVVTMAEGEQTAWHEHGAPLFGYILEGEITVEYEGLGERVYREGDGFLEAMAVPHQGRNSGEGRARVLAIFLMGDGGKPTLPADPPAE